MKLKSIFPLTLLLVLFVLYASASVSLASEEANRDPERDLRQCEQRCQRQQPYFEEHLCRQRCEREERDRRQDIVVSEEMTTRLGGAEEEYEQCQQRCRGTGKGQWQCQRRCQDQYEAALERQREEHEHHGGHGGRGERRPRQHGYRQCAHDCEEREEGFPRQRQCKLRCEEEFGRGDPRHGRHHGRGRRERDDNHHHHKRTKEEEEESDNPYHFDSQSFESRYSTREGHMRVLQRFSEKSELLLGIDKFRLAFYEANPNTFMLPHHWDADSVLFIVGGLATITFLRQENRQTFNIERGDVLMIPAGTTAYMVSSHNNERLQIAELLHPVNTPGGYEQFFGVGGKEPESFFNSFSTEVLHAALNVSRAQLERFFKQKKEGAIVKARPEQVRVLARHRMSTKRMGEFTGPFNLLNERPKFSNDHGEFFEVSPNEYELLEDLDISVTYCDIKQGSMMAPHYNSRSTNIVMVEEGSGYIEMACPHLGTKSNSKKEKRQDQRSGSPSYKKVRFGLSKGEAFVIPAGHPVALIASENENLRTVGFGINAENNQMNFLAGQENIINLLDREAKELSFQLPATEVEEMFQKQRKSYFMPGPQQRQSALVSILDFAGF